MFVHIIWIYGWSGKTTEPTIFLPSLPSFWRYSSSGRINRASFRSSQSSRLEIIHSVMASRLFLGPSSRNCGCSACRAACMLLRPYSQPFSASIAQLITSNLNKTRRVGLRDPQFWASNFETSRCFKHLGYQGLWNKWWYPHCHCYSKVQPMGVQSARTRPLRSAWDVGEKGIRKDGGIFDDAVHLSWNVR